MKKLLLPIIWIAAFEAVSFSIGKITQADVTGWYANLTPPPLVPPDFVFPIVWTTLYALLAVAGSILWQNRVTFTGRTRFITFAVYMGLNWSWSIVFFSMHMMLPALIGIVVMDILLAYFVVTSWSNHRAVALLLLPTLMWTFFATYLNAGYWYLNQ